LWSNQFVFLQLEAKDDLEGDGAHKDVDIIGDNVQTETSLRVASFGTAYLFESQVYVLFYLQPYYCFTLLLLPYIIILFLHLLSTNHKCTQPCYFPLLYKPAAQKVKIDWNYSMRSFRLCAALVTILVVFGAFHCFAS
jgi:hypothetical protein